MPSGALLRRLGAFALVGAALVAAVWRFPALLRYGWSPRYLPIHEIEWLGFWRGLESTHILGPAVLGATGLLCLMWAIVASVGILANPPACRSGDSVRGIPGAASALQMAVALQFIASAAQVAFFDPVWGRSAGVWKLAWVDWKGSRFLDPWVMIDAALAVLVITGIAAAVALFSLLRGLPVAIAGQVRPSVLWPLGAQLRRVGSQVLLGLALQILAWVVLGAAWLVMELGGLVAVEATARYPAPQSLVEVATVVASFPLAAQALLLLSLCLFAWAVGWAVHSLVAGGTEAPGLSDQLLEVDWLLMARFALVNCVTAASLTFVLPTNVSGRIDSTDYWAYSGLIPDWYVQLDPWAAAFAAAAIVSGVVFMLAGFVRHMDPSPLRRMDGAPGA